MVVHIFGLLWEILFTVQLREGGREREMQVIVNQNLVSMTISHRFHFLVSEDQFPKHPANGNEKDNDEWVCHGARRQLEREEASNQEKLNQRVEVHLQRADLGRERVRKGGRGGREGVRKMSLFFFDSPINSSTPQVHVYKEGHTVTL